MCRRPIRFADALATALLVLCATSAAAQTPSFIAPQLYPAGLNPTAFAVADFNGDGHLDLVSADVSGERLSVLPGAGDGSFGAALALSDVPSPGCIVAADFNLDGKLDLAICNKAGNSSSILLGNGNGTFQPAGSVALNAIAGRIVVGDFNRDGLPDIVAADSSEGYVTIVLGHGDGTFGSPAQIAGFARDGNHGLAAGDFNGDGVLDLAAVSGASSSDDSVLIYFGRGDGTFQPGPTYPAAFPLALAVADVNHDGALDIVAATFSSPAGLNVFLGRGDGTFQSPLMTPTTHLSGAIAVADFNKDGRLDLAVTSGEDVDVPSFVDVFAGNGDGTFQASVSIVLSRQGDGTVGGPVGIGDFDGDGLPDVVLSYYYFNDTDPDGWAAVLLDGTPPPNTIWTAISDNVRAGVDSLTKLAGCDGCFDAGAVSKATIASGDGYLEFATSGHVGLRDLGLAHSFTAYDASTIDFDLRLESGYVEVREHDVYRADAPAVAGDVFRIVVTSGVVTYVRNGAVFYTSAAAPAYPLVVAAALASLHADVTGVSFASTAQTPPPPPDGDWSRAANVAVPTSNAASKNDGCDGCYDAWAVFDQRIIAGDGDVEFAVDEAGPLLVAGLTDSFTEGDATSIAFGLRFQAGDAEVREDGVYQADVTFAAGDVFRISVEDGVVSYAKNDEVFYTSAASPTYPLSFAVAFANLGASISGVIMNGGT